MENIKIRQGEPIEALGLMFYPIKMSEYELFLTCKDALIVRLGTLPVKYQMKDYLNAIFAFDLATVAQNGEFFGLFARLITLLSLSLRIDIDIKKWFTTKNVNVQKVADDLIINYFTLTQGTKRVKITPIDFSSIIRPLIAVQNGIELPDESENTELILAEQKVEAIKTANAPKLKMSIDDLIASVAYASHVRERDVMKWTVKEFEARKRAIERDKHYMIYGQAEMSGMVSFKNGNPYPHWAYDRLDETHGTMSLGSLGKNMGGLSTK